MSEEQKELFNNENQQEGTIILDPEMKAKVEKKREEEKAKQEKMKLINELMKETLTNLEEKAGLKIYVAAYQPELDEVGVWKSKNLNFIEEVGLSKIIDGQFN